MENTTHATRPVIVAFTEFGPTTNHRHCPCGCGFPSHGERTLRTIEVVTDGERLRMHGHSNIQLKSGSIGPRFGGFEDGNQEAIIACLARSGVTL